MSVNCNEPMGWGDPWPSVEDELLPDYECDYFIQRAAERLRQQEEWNDEN